MTDFERKIIIKILQENRDMQKTIDNLSDSIQLLIDIQTEILEKK